MGQYAQVNQMYWNGSIFQWIFYAGILLILVFERRRINKVVFGVYPIVMIIGMFNPVTSMVVGRFFSNSDVYYVRLFSVIPVFYCIAYGLTLVIKKTRGAIRLVCTCAAVALIIISGNCVYQEPWMQKAENLQKVPNEVFQVLDVIPREKENARVAFPEPLDLYARQVDGSITMPYGRQYDAVMTPLLKELNKSIPDVTKVISLALNNSVDYVVVSNNQEARVCFSEVGYEPIAETADYYVYSVTGTVTYDLVLNEKRQKASETARDSNGLPTYSWKSVITTRKYEYDRWGNCIKETYFDKDGERVSTIEGYFGLKKSYVLHGLAWVTDSMVYLDDEDQPMLASGRYETRYKYSRQKDIIEESYYDCDGKPMNRMDGGYAKEIKQFDDNDRLISVRFFDTSGSATESVDGYAAYTRDYDKYGHITAERYFDMKGDKINNWAGFAEWIRTYDDDGNVITELFVDDNGSIVDVKSLLARDTSFDLLQWARKESINNSVGVGYFWHEDGSCTITGNAQGISWNNLIMTDRPFYFINGETYIVDYSNENVVLVIDFYQDSTWSNVIGGLKTTCNTEFTIPQNCGAIVIRLQVPVGIGVDETVHPKIFMKYDKE